ncbi:MAG: hypothetical protein AABY22_01700 [Nanoarchaeota archaeon]
MICKYCKDEVYKYRIYFENGKLVQKCFRCSSEQFLGLSTTKRLMDAKENLWMSPASYYTATHTMLDKDNQPFLDKTGKYYEKNTLISSLKERIK